MHIFTAPTRSLSCQNRMLSLTLLVWLLTPKKWPKSWLPLLIGNTAWRVLFLNQNSLNFMNIGQKTWVETYFFFNYRPFDTLIKGCRRVLLLGKGQGQKPGSATRLYHICTFLTMWNRLILTAMLYLKDLQITWPVEIWIILITWVLMVLNNTATNIKIVAHQEPPVSEKSRVW